MKWRCGPPGQCMCSSLETIDEMVADGRLVYNPDRDNIDIGTYPRKAHRARPRLLEQPEYVAWRKRAEGVRACPSGGDL